jgi:NAD-specific glutamate dehydrogenase
VQSRLNQDVDNARNRVNKNEWEKNQSKEKMENFYQLGILTRNASSTLVVLKERVKTISDGFDDEFKAVTTAQDVETELWKGLKELKNNIWSPDFTSTRDNSLRLILQLLTADDEVFLRQEYYEETEKRIKAAIRTKLGEDAVEKLTAPVPARVSLEDFKLELVEL